MTYQVNAFGTIIPTSRPAHDFFAQDFYWQNCPVLRLWQTSFMHEFPQGRKESFDARLFDAAFLSRLERLHLTARRLFSGKHRADRRSRRTGASLEFADYRNYSSGDDLRGIDWNIYGRLDRLFLKLFEEEEDLPVHLLVDASASMRWSPEKQDVTKLDFALRVAASLAYIALAGLEQVNLQFFTDKPGPCSGLMRGTRQFHKTLAFLSRPPEAGNATALAATIRAFAGSRVRRGILVVFSDLLDPSGYAEGLQLARSQGFDVQVVHILHPQELEPCLLGDWKLEDCETGEAMEVTTSETTLTRYRSELAAYFVELERFCAGRQIGYVRAASNTPFQDLVLRQLRRRRLLQ